VRRGDALDPCPALPARPAHPAPCAQGVVMLRRGPACLCVRRPRPRPPPPLLLGPPSLDGLPVLAPVQDLAARVRPAPAAAAAAVSAASWRCVGLEAPEGGAEQRAVLACVPEGAAAARAAHRCPM